MKKEKNEKQITAKATNAFAFSFRFDIFEENIRKDLSEKPIKYKYSEYQKRNYFINEVNTHHKPLWLAPAMG